MKRLFAILLTLLLVLPQLALGTQAPGAALSDKEMTITLWTGPNWKGVYDPLEENASFTDFFTKAAADFKAIHPNITLQVELIDPQQRAEKLSVAVQSGTTPHIYFESDFLTFDYAHEGLLEPLNDIITEEDKADIPAAIWDAVSANGDTYLFPFCAETGHLGLNVTMFKEAGAEHLLPEGEIGAWTPEQFKEALVALSVLPDVYPFALYCGSPVGDTWTNLMLRMYGAKFFNENGTAVELNQPEGVKALEYLKSLQDEKLVAPGIETMVVGDSIQMFLNKKVAVSMFNNLNYNNLVQGLTDGSIEEPFEFKWAYFPSEGDPMCFSYIKGSIVFNGKDADEIAAAKEFVRFYSNAPYTDASMVLVPFRKSVSEKLRETNPVMASVAESLQYSVPFFQKAPGYLGIRNVFYPEMQAVFTDQKTPQQALDDFAQKVNEMLTKNVERSLLLNP